MIESKSDPRGAESLARRLLVLVALSLAAAGCSSGDEKSLTDTADQQIDEASSSSTEVGATVDGSGDVASVEAKDASTADGTAGNPATDDSSTTTPVDSDGASLRTTTAGDADATTQTPPSTEAPSSAPQPGDRFTTLPPGSVLPSGADCASRVKPARETRWGNQEFNATRGNGNHDVYPRVDGDYAGTTDEIIQWAACKWGIDEDMARAQAAIESWWDMTTGGDRTENQDACHPLLRNGGLCPESIGLLQVRFLYHGEAFENDNAIKSTAYNADYTYAVWRECYEGRLGWLNDVERGQEYVAGDLEGCLGVWFTGRWYTEDAKTYINKVQGYLDRRVWESSDFLNY